MPEELALFKQTLEGMGKGMGKEGEGRYMEGEWKVYGSGKEGDPLTPLRLLALCVLAGLLSGYLLVLTLFALVVALVFIVVAAVFIPLSLLLPRRHTALYLFALPQALAV